MLLQKRVPVWMLLAAVGILLLLFGVGSAIHSAGWWDGFTMGLLTSGSVDGGTLPAYMAYRGGPGWHGGGGFFGGLFRFLFFLFVFALFFKFLGFWRWRMRGSQPPWAHHHNWRHHSQPGPWPESKATGPTPMTGDEKADSSSTQL